MNLSEEVERLKRALRDPLPGHAVLAELSGYPRPPVEHALRLEPTPQASAVLVLLYPKEEQLHTMLMLRPEYAGVHSGQIGFPGGKQEPGDASLLHTALREFNEETGASTDGVDIQGSLSPIHIPPSRTIVTPFIGYVGQLGDLDPDPLEVAALIETPVKELLRPTILKRKFHHVPLLGGEVEIPYYDVQGHVVWGATAMMIAELRELFLRLRDTQTGEQLG